MTYIAKAMNKTTRLEDAAERAADAERVSRANGPANVVDASPAFEFVKPQEPNPARPKSPASPSAAMTVAALGARLSPERPVSDFTALGTLETLPPEPEDSPQKERGPWWREPIVIGAIGLGFGALFIGFLFAPGDEPVVTQVRPAAVGLATQHSQDGTGDPQQISENASSPMESDVSTGTAGSGNNNPVVVRVQIDGGNNGRVEFDSQSASPTRPVSQAPSMPAYFEPLQPLELPPPPVADLTIEEPRPSRYAAPAIREESISDYRLEGIFWSEDNPGAIINDEIVEAGKRIGSLRVLEIHKNYVTVEFEGRTYDLR